MFDVRVCIPGFVEAMAESDTVAVIYVGSGDAVSLERLRVSIADQADGGVRVCGLAADESVGVMEALGDLDVPVYNTIPEGLAVIGFAVHDGRALWRPGFLRAAVDRLAEADSRECGGVYSRTVEVFEKRDEFGAVVDDVRRSTRFSDPLDLWQILTAERLWVSSAVFRPEFLGADADGNEAIEEWSLRAMEDWFGGWLLRHAMAYLSGKWVFVGRPWQEREDAPFESAHRHNERVRRFLGNEGDVAGWAEAFLHRKRAVEQNEERLQVRVAELEDQIDRDSGVSERVWKATYARLSELEAPTEPPAYDELLKGVGVLSLDIFETCHHRKVGHPEDLFVLLREAYLSEGREEMADFVRMRVDSARIARERHESEALWAGRERKEDLGIVEIYAVLCELCGSPKEEAEPLARREFELERTVAYANRWTLGLYREARRRGIRVIFLSDMHLPSAWLRELLDDLGFGEGDVYVSAEVGYTKNSGGLYAWVLKQLNVPKEQILHVGDNPRADVEPARANGLRSFHLHEGYFSRSYVGQLLRVREEPDAARDHRFSPNDNTYRDFPWPSRIAAGIARWHRRTESWDTAPAGGQSLAGVFRAGLQRAASRMPGSRGERRDESQSRRQWHRVGFEAVGPAAFFYAAWIWRQARVCGVERVYFLSRDGYYLRALYRKIAAVWGPAGEDRYLYASRRLLRFATIRHVGARDWDFLLKAAPGLRARDFLERVGVASEPYRESLARHGFSDCDEVVTGPKGWLDPRRRDNMYHVFCDAMDAVVTQAGEERERLHAYLRENQVPDGPAIAVDLGWHASSIDALTEHLRIMGQRWPDLAGCYFASWQEAETVEDRGCTFCSWFAHLGRPEERVRLLEESIALIESFFGAPHGTVSGLRREGGEWRPVCEPMEAGSEAFLEAVWEGAAAFADAYLSLVSQPFEGDGRAYVAAVLERVLRHPSIAEARALGGLPHREGWAAGAMAPIVPEAVGGDRSTRSDAPVGYGGAWEKGSAVLRGKKGR